jgi:hypothetical protein
MGALRYFLQAAVVVGFGALGACGSSAATPEEDACLECKPDDRVVAECPENAHCYSVTCGGASITCERCGCADGEVNDGNCGGDSPSECHFISACGQSFTCHAGCKPDSCKPGDIRIKDFGVCPSDATCYSLNTCQISYFPLCAVGTTCHPASCDPGDTPTLGAPCSTASCYVYEGCTDSIECFDAWPEHECPEMPPSDASLCFLSDGYACHYPTSPGCADLFTCTSIGADLQWVGSGEVCP